METVTISIDQLGKSDVKTSGIKGKSCTEVTKGIEAALGAETTSKTYSPEYYETEKPNDEKIQLRRM